MRPASKRTDGDSLRPIFRKGFPGKKSLKAEVAIYTHADMFRVDHFMYFRQHMHQRDLISQLALIQSPKTPKAMENPC